MCKTVHYEYRTVDSSGVVSCRCVHFVWKLVCLGIFWTVSNGSSALCLVCVLHKFLLFLELTVELCSVQFWLMLILRSCA